MCAAGIARSGSGQPGERQNIGQLQGQKFRGAARGRITGGVYKQCRRRAEHHHDRRESRPGHTEPAMQVRPPVADQRDLHAEQHQPADEGDGMTVDDQGIVQSVLSHVAEAVAPKARQHPQPDPAREREEGVSVRARSRRKAPASDRCYWGSPVHYPPLAPMASAVAPRICIVRAQRGPL